MTRRFLAVITVAAAVVAATIGGVTLAQGSSPTKATPKAHKGTSTAARRHHRATVRHTARAAQAGTDPADQESPGEKPDNESGQEKPDNESANETPDGDGPGGHADEPGNASADHEAQGAE